MSEATRWMIVVIIAAILLSWGFVAWHNRKRPGQVSLAGDSDRINSFWQKHPMIFSLIALVLAGLAQYALRIDQLGFAAFGYWFAIILFVSSLRQFIPVRLIAETPAPKAKSKTKPDQPKLVPTSNDISLSKSVFLQIWHNHILTDLIHRWKPTSPLTLQVEKPLPASMQAARTLLQPDQHPTSESILVNKPISVASSETVSVTNSQTLFATDFRSANIIQSIPSAEDIGETITVPTDSGATPSPALVAVWSGFTQPDSILLTTHGQILVVDVAQQIIFCLNPDGQIVKQWSVPPLPELNGRNLVLSADARHLYITDARKGLVYAITLED